MGLAEDAAPLAGFAKSPNAIAPAVNVRTDRNSRRLGFRNVSLVISLLLDVVSVLAPWVTSHPIWIKIPYDAAKNRRPITESRFVGATLVVARKPAQWDAQRNAQNAGICHTRATTRVAPA
jgi:hypothetical protein